MMVMAFTTVTIATADASLAQMAKTPLFHSNVITLYLQVKNSKITSHITCQTNHITRIYILIPTLHFSANEFGERNC
jgi:hypothetical protein